MSSPSPAPTFQDRVMPHLIAMCDGKGHTFFDHDLAKAMKSLGLICRGSGGGWVISHAGRRAVVIGRVGLPQ